METIINQFRKDKEASLMEAKKLQQEMRESIIKIKVIIYLLFYLLILQSPMNGVTF